MRITLFLLGASLTLVGIALICWKVAIVLGGLFLAYVAIRMDEPTPKVKAVPRAVSQADFNIN